MDEITAVFSNAHKNLLRVIIVISLLGILLSSYLTYLHYQPTASKFCVIGEHFDCDLVNKSSYSELFGIPVAILGGLTYVLFLIAAILLLKNYDFSKLGKLIDEEITTQKVYQFLFILAIIAFLFSLYLTSVESIVLKTYCIFCLISFSFVIALFIILGYVCVKKKFS